MCDKVCYSQKQAGQIVNSLKHRRKNNTRKSFWRKKIPVRYYYCKECKSYHLTSMDYFKEFD